MIFEDRFVSFSAHKFFMFFRITLQPPESRPEDNVKKIQASQASSSKSHETVAADELEKVKEESQSWKQKYQAKSVRSIIYEVSEALLIFPFLFLNFSGRKFFFEERTWKTSN